MVCNIHDASPWTFLLIDERSCHDSAKTVSNCHRGLRDCEAVSKLAINSTSRLTDSIIV